MHVILFWLLADVCRQCLDCFLFCPICGRALFCAIFAASNCSVLFVVCSIQHLLLSEFYFGIRRVLFWQLQSPMLALAALHSGVQTRRILKMLSLKLGCSFENFGLRFWETLRFECSFENVVCAFGSPGHLSREAFGFAPCMCCVVVCSHPASSLFLILMRSGRQPSGIHP